MSAVQQAATDMKAAAEVKQPSLKVVGLQIENFKRLVAVNISPEGNVIEITGRNSAGKSSVLDALWVALRGKAVAPPKPIRDGAERAVIRVDLGELIVIRTFRLKADGDYTTDLRVETPDGGRFSGPQDVLNAVIGPLSFDPLAFIRADRKTQFNELRALVPGVDYAAIDRLNKADYTKRTTVNARAEHLRAQAGPTTSFADAPAERIDESALIDRLQESVNFNSGIERERASREYVAAQRQSAADERDRCDDEIKSIEKKLEEARHRRAGLQQAWMLLDDQVNSFASKPLQSPIDAGDIKSKLESAKQKNAAFDARERHNAMIADAEIAEFESAELTASMEKRTADVQAAVAAAKIPVEGVSFGNEEILLFSVPLVQASTSQQMRCSVVLSMLKSGRLRLAYIRDGSLLDDESMRILAALAEEFDFQLWIERVQSGAPTGILIEDGYSRQNQQAAE